ncbi:glycosyltransferase family 4 protein [Robiginitalea aurantiaca]|uniref:Glycosyltransferase family 4 protein n=1 Tax=Robiginitalea aurantiaca TaxID=3056915 RepID=A0ABT7WIN0_9FLAO|nr:glycosyltransferase family 4 protein [Robiginitalea aurantiaca]MDM9632789.1 glycosyltransferase family 4 protein [Robiginitalea aurantiaca]
MKVVFLALSFSDVRNSSNLYVDLMHEFRSQGHEVFVIAPSIDDEKKSQLKDECGVKVLRVPTLKLFGTGKIMKGISNMLLPRQFKRALKRHNVPLDFDLIILPTPPITLIDVGLWLKKKSGGILYLILRDIFPQNAVDLKMMKPKGPVYQYFRKKEVELYNGSDSIGCMSPANIRYVLEHNPYLDPSKLHLLPNWEKAHEVPSDKDDDEIRERYGLKDKFVVIFGGGHGLPQRMENVLDLAKECEDYHDILFFLVGPGTEKKRLERLAKEMELENVSFMDYVPRYDFNKVLSLADVGLISLNQDFTIPNFPSKVNSYFSNKIPVLASIDVNTDFGTMLEERRCGLWSEAGNTASFKKNLLRLYNDENLRKEFGENGYNYLINNLLPHHAYDIICNNI